MEQHAGFFGRIHTEGTPRAAAEFAGLTLEDFRTTEPGFEMVNAGVALGIDAAQVVIATAAFAEPLHQAPLEQVGAFGFHAFGAGGAEEVHTGVTDSGADQAGQQLAVLFAKEDAHFEQFRKGTLDAGEFFHINGGFKLFAGEELAVDGCKLREKGIASAFPDCEAVAFRGIELVAPFLAAARPGVDALKRLAHARVASFGLAVLVCGFVWWASYLFSF